ncbi:MAG: hypothetical protein ACRCX2_20445 [Paraclostridium sp.]
MIFGMFKVGDRVKVKDSCMYEIMHGEIGVIVDIRESHWRRPTVSFSHLKSGLDVGHGANLHNANMAGIGNACLFLDDIDLEIYDEEFWRL